MCHGYHVYGNVFKNALHPPAVIIVHQHRLIRNLTHLRLAILCITHTFHPLPDRDRSRIASGLSVQRLPPVVVTLLLIVWVTLSGDTRNVLVESVGFEPTHPLLNDRLAICWFNHSPNSPMLGAPTPTRTGNLRFMRPLL